MAKLRDGYLTQLDSKQPNMMLKQKKKQTNINQIPAKICKLQKHMRRNETL